MQKLRLRVWLGGLLVAGGVCLGLWGQAAIPAQAKSSQAVTWYRQWKKAYVRGGQQKYVQTNDGHGASRVYSEGQGYGMLASVLAAKRGVKTHTTFNQLYRYYRAHRVSKANPLMQWQQIKRQGKLTSVGSERNSATDGDLDIAYALILADKQWGSRKVNYRQAARQLLVAIQRSEINPTTHLPMMGNWATTANDQRKLRTADLMTGYFRAFAKVSQKAKWTRTANQSQKMVKKLSAQHKTGLFPDFTYVTGKHLTRRSVRPNTIESATDNQVGYNACRVPWRLAQTYRLTHDATTKRALTKQLNFFQRRSKVTAVYTLGGRAVYTYQNAAFTAPVVTAARVLKRSTLQRKFAKQLPAKIQKHDYYSATLQMITAFA